jgi:hypothetical protein
MELPNNGVIWTMSSDQADELEDAAFERLIDARRAYLDEPVTPGKWNETIDRLFNRLQEAKKDFVDAFHVAETVAHIVDDIRIGERRELRIDIASDAFVAGDDKEAA